MFYFGYFTENIHRKSVRKKLKKSIIKSRKQVKTAIKRFNLTINEKTKLNRFIYNWLEYYYTYPQQWEINSEKINFIIYQKYGTKEIVCIALNPSHPLEFELERDEKITIRNGETK